MSEDGWAGMSKLTKTGWPRPIVGGLPIPWISPSDELSTVNPARHSACASGAVCAVCGEGFGNADAAYVFIREEAVPENIADGIVHAMDNGVLHSRCAKLALKHCPRLKQLQADGLLKIIATVGNIADPTWENERLMAAIDGALCAVVEEIP